MTPKEVETQEQLIRLQRELNELRQVSNWAKTGWDVLGFKGVRVSLVRHEHVLNLQVSADGRAGLDSLAELGRMFVRAGKQEMVMQWGARLMLKDEGEK